MGKFDKIAILILGLLKVNMFIIFWTMMLLLLSSSLCSASDEVDSIVDTPFEQEYRIFYTEDDGLLGSYIFEIMIEASGKIWAVTDRGISVFDGELWYKKEVFPEQMKMEDAVKILNKIKKKEGILFKDKVDCPKTSGFDGLPDEDIKFVLCSQNDDIWIVTSYGCYKFNRINGKLRYYAGKRWLPSNAVTTINFGIDNSVWIGTEKGISRIMVKEMTLKEKALYYENLTQSRHNRMGMIARCALEIPEELSSFRLIDNDNDGQWTQMYLAAESFRWAVTHEDEALKNARDSYKAMVKLNTITGISGYPARSIVKIEDCKGKDKKQWHPSDDGKYCWKGDTSNDEVLGHMFGFPIYYDLVASEEEKEEIKEIVTKLLNHIIEHDFQLVGLSGETTTHGHWDPFWINRGEGVFGDQGLNSLQMLSFLRSGYHITGNKKYLDTYFYLIEEHHYHKNALNYKKISDRLQINHDSDEMAFLAFYNLIRYEDNPELKEIYIEGIRRAWKKEKPERNPEFNFIYGSAVQHGYGLDDAIATLREMPLDLIYWDVKNSHRKDIEISHRRGRFGELQAVFPLHPAERPTMKWNSNPYRLDEGGGGGGEECAFFWLLPFWMARYHGFIK